MFLNEKESFTSSYLINIKLHFEFNFISFYYTKSIINLSLKRNTLFKVIYLKMVLKIQTKNYNHSHSALSVDAYTNYMNFKFQIFDKSFVVGMKYNKIKGNMTRFTEHTQYLFIKIHYLKNQ